MGKEMQAAAEAIEKAEAGEAQAFNAAQDAAKAAYEARAQHCAALVVLKKARERYAAVWKEAVSVAAVVNAAKKKA